MRSDRSSQTDWQLPVMRIIGGHVGKVTVCLQLVLESVIDHDDWSTGL